jgi:hypothetical protein
MDRICGLSEGKNGEQILLENRIKITWLLRHKLEDNIKVEKL